MIETFFAGILSTPVCILGGPFLLVLCLLFDKGKQACEDFEEQGASPSATINHTANILAWIIAGITAFAIFAIPARMTI